MPGASPAEALASPLVTTRRCSRTACSAPAVSTLTYAYTESTAVIGPLAPYVEPHTYDLCVEHVNRLTVPRGWAVVHVQADPEQPVAPSDDLEALAKAVSTPTPAPAPDDNAPRRGHLRVISTP